LRQSGLKQKCGLSRGRYGQVTGENVMSKKLLVCLVSLIFLSVLSHANGKVLIGAIRWDDWVTTENYPYSTWSRYLEPEQWHYRHPFFAQLDICKLVLRCDNQKATDQEIAYAKQAGLDYFAYGYYYPGDWTGADRYNYCLYQYLASTHKSDVKFCIRLGGDGTVSGWTSFMIPMLVNLFKEPSYQTVAGGRPLVYMFGADSFTTLFGSDANAKAALTALRTAAVNAGCGSPYIVCMVWSATDGKNYINNQGYNAMSAYTHLSWTAGNQEYPYSALVAENAGFWDECKATGKKVIPIVNIGWDNRPQRADGYSAPGPWYTEPNMTEWKNNLQAAVNWVNNNPSAAEPNAIIIYAWNELTEGGWLVPTRGPGTARIEATAQVLNP